MTLQTLFHMDPRSVADTGDELSIQVRLKKALKLRAPAIKFVAIPNGAQRTAWSAMKAKQEGLQAGFPDVLLLWNGGSAFVEIKTATGSLSDQQHVWLNWLATNNHLVGVFRSVDSCLAWLSGIGAPVELKA